MRFLINTGKGGVGKTTVSAAMASAFASRGKRVLLMQLNVKDKLGEIYGAGTIGPEIIPLVPNVWAVNTTPKDAMREYALMTIRMKAVYKAVFENKVVSRFLKVIPGMPELTMLGKAYYHESETNERGIPRWDVVIIDAPATGHGRFLLQIPQVITSALGSGSMAQEARKILDLLEDPERTMINLVTLPEEMPVNETVELHTQLRSEFDVRIGSIIANGVLPQVLSPTLSRHLHTLSSTYGEQDDELGSLLAAAKFREERMAMQSEYLERLARELDAPVLEVPFFFEPSLTPRILEQIGSEIGEQIDRRARS